MGAMDAEQVAALRELLSTTVVGGPHAVLRPDHATQHHDAAAGCSSWAPPTEEPWHLTAHLSDEARLSGIPELAPTSGPLVRSPRARRPTSR